MPSNSNRSLADLLRHVAPAGAAAARVFCDARHLHALRRPGGLEALQIAHPDDRDASGRSPAPAADPGRIVFAHLAGTLAVDLDLADYPALRFVAGVNRDAAHEALRNAVANALLKPLLQQFNAAGLGTWRVMSVERADDFQQRDDATRFDIALLRNGAMHRVSIDASAATLDLIRARLAALPARGVAAVNAPFDALCVGGSIALGSRRVSIAALQRLRPGDVLLRTFAPATARALVDGEPVEARAVWGTAGRGTRRVHAIVSIDGTHLFVQDDPIMSEQDLRAHAPDTLPTVEEGDEYNEYDATEPACEAASGHEELPLDIGQLDLPIQFEIDSVTLPLAELAALRRGYVIELPTPVIDAPIRLVSHGQTVGHGELVSVGEHLGIRITRMAYAYSSGK